MRNDATETWVIGVGGAGEAIVGRWARTHADAGVRFTVGLSEPAQLARAAGVFVVVGLGGPTGGPRAILEVTRAKLRGATTTVLAIRPFSFEGRGRRRCAETALAALHDVADSVHVFDNDDLLRKGAEDLDLQGAYRKCDDQLWETVFDFIT